MAHFDSHTLESFALSTPDLSVASIAHQAKTTDTNSYADLRDSTQLGHIMRYLRPEWMEAPRVLKLHSLAFEQRVKRTRAFSTSVWLEVRRCDR